MKSRRITDAAKLNIAFETPEYPTVCPWSEPWSATGSHLLLLRFDHFALYTDDGAFLRDLPILASQEPRWSSDPQAFYYIHQNFVMSWRTDGKVGEVVHEFREYGSVSGYGESDCVKDCLVLGGKRKDGTVDVFVYDFAGKTKGPVIQTDGRFNGLYLTSSLQVVITWNADTGRGIEAVEWEVANIGDEDRDVIADRRRIAPILSHQCVCRWEGENYLIYANSPDPSVNNNGVESIRIRDGRRTLLASFDWRFALHVAPTSHGWILAENYCKGTQGALWRVWLDGRPKELLVEHGSNGSTYEGQPKAVVSRDGSKVVYGSNMGGSVVDTYLVDLDSTPHPIQVDPEDGWELVSRLTPGNEILWRVREDGSTWDAYDVVKPPDELWKLQRIDYPDEKQRWQLRPYQGGLRMFRKAHMP